MSRRRIKRRPLTAAEREEVRMLAMRGRMGRMSEGDMLRCQELHNLDPDGYGEAQVKGRAEVDRSMNPLSGSTK